MKYGAIQVNVRNALDIGKAAEHLVCADLLISGEQAYLSDQGLPYDVVVDRDGHLFRVQVKATCSPKELNARGRASRLGYSFSVRRRGRNGDSRLSNSDCDIVACVALDIMAIAYLPIYEVGTTCQLMGPDHSFHGKFKRNKYRPITGFPFIEAISRMGGRDV